MSPPGPALPERRYRDDYQAVPAQTTDRPPTQSPSHQIRHPAPNSSSRGQGHQLTEANVRGHDRQHQLQVDVRARSQHPSHGGDGRGQSRGQDIPPYRGLHPPPYPAGSAYHSGYGLDLKVVCTF